MPPLIFGVAFGNLLLGVPFYFEDIMVSHYTGSFWGLLSPFALLAGVVSSAMITFHGANYLMIRTAGDIFERARRAGLIAGVVMIVAFLAAGVWVAGLDGYVITSAVDPAAAPNPLAKTVIREEGAWLANYGRFAWSWLVPVATVIFMPLIVFYTSWAYRVMAGKVTPDYIRANDKSAY